MVLRRAALTAYSSIAWRTRLGELAGVRVAAQPAVSVVMATRRPDLLEHALGQVARQRGVDRLELVLAPHGFEPDAARVREALSVGGGVEVQVVPQPERRRLRRRAARRGVTAASGDVVLKMDDDDWYAPDVVADLLLARSYSGAELVGMPDDVYYLEPTDETVRLGQPSEVYRQFVAGGTLMVDRGLLREVGGFRTVRRHVDAELIAAVRAAGGATYRTHGLGYVLRRTDSGHTWQADLDDLRARAAQVTARLQAWTAHGALTAARPTISLMRLRAGLAVLPLILVPLVACAPQDDDSGTPTSPASPTPPSRVGRRGHGPPSRLPSTPAPSTSCRCARRAR